MPTDSYATAVSNYASDPDNMVDRALNTDPIAAAEEVTGKSYKNDKATDALGVLMHIDHAKNKETILRAHGDTTMNNTFMEYMAVVLDLGFEVVQARPFEYKGYRDREPVTLHNVVAVHPEGAVLIFDTYMRGGYESQGEHVPLVEVVNGGQLFYNWKPGPEYRRRQEEAWALNEDARELRKECDQIAEGTPAWEALNAEVARLYNESRAVYPPHVTSSGGMENSNPEIPDEIPNPDYDPERPYDYDDNSKYIKNPEFSRDQWVYVGYHDCREGLRFNFNKLREWGSFLTPWVKMPWGVDTLDLNESRLRYYHAMWPPNSTYDERVPGEASLYPRGVALPPEGQALRIAHEVIGHEMEAQDVQRWPERLVEIIGEQAITQEWQEHAERVSKELERHGLTRDDLPEIERAA